VLGSDPRTSLQQQLESQRAMEESKMSSEVQEQKAQESARAISTAIQQGEFPPNSAIAEVLERGERSAAAARNDPNLSSQGKATAQDVQNIITGLKQTALEKNEDESLQKLVHHTKEASLATQAAASSSTTVGGSQVAQMRQDLQVTINATTQLVNLMIRSNEFRGLMHDILNLLVNIVLNKKNEMEPLQPQSNIQDNMSQLQDRTSGFADKIQQTIQDENVRNQIIEKFQFWMSKVNKQPEYRQGIRDLIISLEEFTGHASNATDLLSEDPQILEARVHIAKARHEAKKLLERFADGYSLNSLIEALRDLKNDVDTHERLRMWLQTRVRTFAFRCLDDPNFIETQEFRNELDSLLRESQTVLEQYRPHFDNLFNQASNFVNAFKGDPTLQNLSTSTQSLVRRLFLDDAGRPTLKPGALLELRKIIGPLVQEEIKYIYIPRLSSDDESMTWVMENILLHGEDIMPDKIVIENYNKAVLAPNPAAPKPEEEATGSVFRIHITGIRANVKDVHMAYRRKTFPKMEDVISFDAVVGGSGLSIEIILNASKQPNHVYRIVNVNCDVDDLTLKNISGVEHSSALYTVFKPIIESQARKNMAEGIKESLRERLIDLDQMLISYRDQISID